MNWLLSKWYDLLMQIHNYCHKPKIQMYIFGKELENHYKRYHKLKKEHPDWSHGKCWDEAYNPARLKVNEWKLELL